MKILHRYTKKCLFEAIAKTKKELAELAVKNEADLWGANLREANLREANLWGADLRGANLMGANLRGANLREADLWEANLREADLWGADLWGANLWEANLREANLRGADLWEANLREADLMGANLYSELNLLRLLKSSQHKLWETFNYYLTNTQLCHSPSESFNSLCGCDKTNYRSDAALHFTFGNCHENEMIYCIPYDDPHKSIRQHKKGKCPYTEYKVR